MSRQTWIKICGLRDVATARLVADAGADAIGLNFFPKSVRCVTPETAADIAAALPPHVLPVGLFVNTPADEVARICHACHLPAAQLHGDETPQYLADLQRRAPELKMIWARRVTPADLPALGQQFEVCRSLGVKLFACLLDAAVAGAYGGTGQTLPWSEIAAGYATDWPPLILAGGLKPDNVGDAVRTVRPWGVDTASGVEAEPGVKDLDRVRQFVAAVRGN